MGVIALGLLYIIGDEAIGYTVLETIKNNKKFEIMFGLPSEDLTNAENYLIVSIFYAGFPDRQINEALSVKIVMKQSIL